MHFATITGLYLLGFIIPLIILYLIKAKPKELTIPSLLFFSDDKKVKKYNSMLKKLLIRALFFLQLLFILLLAFSAADPIIKVPMDAYSLNTVVIMDVSSSMSTKDTTISRMDAGKQELLKNIKGSTSVILAEESPVVLATNVSASRARALISNLEAKDIPTRIDSSILLANELLGKERGTVIIYSDFLLNKEDDILAAKKIAEANDKRVMFIQTGQKQPNLGWVTLNFNRGKGEAFVKNFGDKKRVIDIKLFSNNQQKETKRIDITPFSVERIGFDVTKGETILEIADKDALGGDNKVYLVNPYESENSILFITNNPENNPLLDALESNPQFKVDITRPPVIPDLKYDVVVISDVNQNLLLPNTFRDIKKYKDNNGKVIITSQENFNSLDLQGLVDFKIGKMVNAESEICVDYQNEFTSKLSPRCFASASKYNELNLDDNGSIAIASAKENPIFVMQGKNLFYYGIIDKYSGFKEQISYPLFWDDLIGYMLGKESLSNFNFNTGDVLLGDNRSGNVILDKAGIFDINGKKIAVNILNSDESNIFRESIIKENEEFQGKYEKVKLEVNLDEYLLVLALLLFGYELFYIKRRGDL